VLFKPDQKLKDMYQQIADLSKKQCESDCFKLDNHIGSCCSVMYCEIAKKLAEENGVKLETTDNPKLPFMGRDGCVVPPWLRPMCSIHICDKSLLDAKFSKKYFSLREKMELHENDLFMQENRSSNEH